MDLDLSTHGSAIKECIGKLNTGNISWMILGYSDNRTLYIVETGDNSLEDMFDEFQGSEIMYGFASVIDPNTKLKKNIFIHWQGAGAKQVMKTKSMQHGNVVRELLKPIHVTLNARDPQDLDLKEVMQKVTSASGSNYSVHTEKQQIYETKPVVKSQCNTASAIQDERRKELASLGNMKKEFSINQKINSPPSINSTKPFSLDTKPGFTKVGTNYEKINPEKEFKSLNIKQKTTYETPARIQSENNTAERAREERQKELSKLANRTFVDEGFQKVGTNYTKINPIAEIQQLKRQSVSVESENSITPPSANFTKCAPREEIMKLRKESINNDDEVISSPTSSYKKIDPYSEIQELKKFNAIAEPAENISESSYKKINPAEEIKNLKSKSEFNFEESVPVPSSYKKINPIEEIMSAKKTSVSYNETISTNENRILKKNTGSHNNFEEKKPIQRLNSTSEQKSARSTFEKLHKSIEDPNFNIEKTSTQFNVKPKDTTTVKKEEKVNTKSIGLQNKEQNVKKTKRAVAIFDFDVRESDEVDFVVGEIITDIEEIDEGWWIGCNKAGKKGMFPSNYVELMATDDESIVKEDNNSIVKQENSNEDINTESLTVVAVYSYNTSQDDEISFEEGDRIYNVIQVDKDWWVGETKDGGKGMFPSNYVVIP